MTEITGEKSERVLNLLGLARRAGKLIIGQDKVLAAAKSGVPMLVVAANDISAAVMRSLRPHEKKGAVTMLQVKEADRAELGARLGISSTQITALSEQDGLAKKILIIFNDGSDADE